MSNTIITRKVISNVASRVIKFYISTTYIYINYIGNNRAMVCERKY